MKTYVVQWDYESSLGGKWTKGQEIDIDPELAKRINIDSPGVLVDKDKKRQKKGSKDRQKKSASTRSKS